MSKQIQAMMDKYPGKFDQWFTEDNNERGLDYWVYCNEPWFDPFTETGTIHEDTVADTLAAMRRVIRGKYNGHSWEPE